jgi:hypothetical protein
MLGNFFKKLLKSNNDMLKTRLNTYIATGDIHSIDFEYHKSCWKEHVLINLIDVQTQNQA